MNDTIEKKSVQSLPRSIKWVSSFIGGGSLVYFFLFLILGTRVSIQLDLSVSKALVLDMGLSLLFFVQHSIMVRKKFKEQVFNKISGWISSDWNSSGPAFSDLAFAALYSITSGITLVGVILFWQGTGPVFLVIPVWGKIIMGSCILFAVAGFQWGNQSLSGFNPFGSQPEQTDSSEKPILKIKGPYRFMRHPLYFFALVMIWCSTSFTADRLMFNLLWTGWIFLGTWLEEKDLVDQFGATYEEYQKQTPMIVPIKISLLKKRQG